MATALLRRLVLALFTRSRADRWLPPAVGLRVLRRVFAPGGADRIAAIAPHVPSSGHVVHRDLVHSPRLGRAGLFDLVVPTAPARGLVVWLHGGGWYYGDKAEVTPYLEVLAGHGYAGASLNYPLAPEHRHPAAPRAVATGLGRVLEEAAAHGVDVRRVVLAGDSSGAHVAGQVAAALTRPAYAEALGARPPAVRPAGLVACCGIVDPRAIGDSDRVFASVLGTSMWALAGTRRWQASAAADLMDLTVQARPEFPPTLVLSAVDDPLHRRQSAVLVDHLSDRGVDVENVFYEDADRAIGHAFQFALDTPEAADALERILGFLARVTG